MGTIRVRATTFDAPDFTNPQNAVDGGTGTWAAWVDSKRRGKTSGTFGGFDFSGVPAGATVESVTAYTRHYEDMPGDMDTFLVAGVSIPLTVGPVEHSADLGTTLPTDVLCDWNRGNNTRQTDCAIDYLDVEVTYADFLGSQLQAWDGSQWVTGNLKKWNGSSWEGAMLRRWDGSQWVDVGGSGGGPVQP
jgi:hypothetical protein